MHEAKHKYETVFAVWRDIEDHSEIKSMMEISASCYWGIKEEITDFSVAFLESWRWKIELPIYIKFHWSSWRLVLLVKINSSYRY